VKTPLRRSAILGLALVPFTGIALAPPASASTSWWPSLPQSSFVEEAPYAVSGEVAEILTATPDGRTVVYTDAGAGEIGFVDVSRPWALRELGTVELEGEPTSVTITPDGAYALAAVDTTDGDFENPSGYLAVVSVAGRGLVRTIDLGGQPDSIALSPDGSVGAIAMENQRNEEIEVDGVEGGLPQLPAGFLANLDLTGAPADWTVSAVELTGLPGLEFAEDPEPEFVDVNADGIAALTLQENNAIALIDLHSGTVLNSFSAGWIERDDADLTDDDVVSFTEHLTAPREPDGIQWTNDGNLITANEGDYAETPAGGRGWTVFAPTGDIVWESGSSAERALADAGRYPDGRSDAKGAEFEGTEIGSFGGSWFSEPTEYAFIGSERGDAVLVYDMTDETNPALTQVLPTGEAPEGVLAVPQRNLFLASNEDSGTISVFRYTWH
jgi:DNA-binding beta-propeller fold protein YncE